MRDGFARLGGSPVKIESCAICGSRAEACFREDTEDDGILKYGCFCKNSSHFIEPVFRTMDDAVAAWNETQRFLRRYWGEMA